MPQILLHKGLTESNRWQFLHKVLEPVNMHVTLLTSPAKIVRLSIYLHSTSSIDRNTLFLAKAKGYIIARLQRM